MSPMLSALSIARDHYLRAAEQEIDPAVCQRFKQPVNSNGELATKLRGLLYYHASETWIRLAALGVMVPEFDQRLADADYQEQVLWSAILDAERLAGADAAAASAEPHLLWLLEYERTRAEIDDPATEEDTPRYAELCGRMNHLERILVVTPAVTREAVIAQLFTVARIVNDGAVPATEQVEPIVAAAKAVLGLSGEPGTSSDRRAA